MERSTIKLKLWGQLALNTVRMFGGCISLELQDKTTFFHVHDQNFNNASFELYIVHLQLVLRT